jgi:SAM-dependent methyltransferase
MIQDATQSVPNNIIWRFAVAAYLSSSGLCIDGLVVDPAFQKWVSSYTREELDSLPEESFLGLGCANPGAVASVRLAETVLDLGSGGGIDCFLADRKAGNSGTVIGVDMTPEMVRKSRDSALKHGYDNIDFRLGEIENLPVANNSVDVIISNCVINLSTDKPKVFTEAFRVLKPGGRLAVADMVAAEPLPEEVQNDLSLYVGCVAGAVFVDDLETMLAKAGFQNILIRFIETDANHSCNCAQLHPWRLDSEALRPVQNPGNNWLPNEFPAAGLLDVGDGLIQLHPFAVLLLGGFQLVQGTVDVSVCQIRADLDQRLSGLAHYFAVLFQDRLHLAASFSSPLAQRSRAFAAICSRMPIPIKRPASARPLSARALLASVTYSAV